MVVQLDEGDTGVGGSDKWSRRPAARLASDAELVGSSGGGGVDAVRFWVRGSRSMRRHTRRYGRRRQWQWWFLRGLRGMALAWGAGTSCGGKRRT
jgi:hypothetical protein